MSFSIVIPSRSVANLAACVEAIRKAGETCAIIVVWDAPKTGDPRVQDLWDVQNLLNEVDPLRHSIVVRGKQPFVFSANCNIGIAATADDVILLNDDALLEEPLGFTRMSEATRVSLYGLVSATTNHAGNPAQHRRAKDGMRLCGQTPGNSFATVAFVCVLIPRSTIKTVGLMDERFGGTTPEGKRIYGHCDNDYCRRVHLADMKIGIFDGCYVDHGKLTSSFRSEPYDMDASRKIYLDKWKTM